MQLGDYILTSEVQSRDGSARYRAMADYANRMGYVIEERRIPIQNVSFSEAKESMVTQDVYQIVEPPLPEPPTRKEELEQELDEINAWYDKHHYIAEKIAYGRATRDEYADVIAETEVKAQRINEIRAELAAIDKAEKEAERARMEAMHSEVH